MKKFFLLFFLVIAAKAQNTNFLSSTNGTTTIARNVFTNLASYYISPAVLYITTGYSNSYSTNVYAALGVNQYPNTYMPGNLLATNALWSGYTFAVPFLVQRYPLQMVTHWASGPMYSTNKNQVNVLLSFFNPVANKEDFGEYDLNGAYPIVNGATNCFNLTITHNLGGTNINVTTNGIVSVLIRRDATGNTNAQNLYFMGAEITRY